jgi:hypothetical protein
VRFGGIFDYDVKAERLHVVNAELEDPNVWNDPKRAQELGREKKSIEGVVDTLSSLAQAITDSLELFELAASDNDDETLESIETDAAQFQATLEGMEFRRMFSNPADPLNCFLDIQSGAGGTEAQDWASMLLRQYLRYAERKGFKAELLEESEGEVAGIKSATIKIEGEYAFGFFVEEQLGHAFITAGCQRAAAGRPRKHRLVVGDPLFFCLRFGESHPRHFRIGVGDRRDGACVEGDLVPGDDLCGELSLVGGLVREHWSAHHITDGIYTWDSGGTGMVIDGDKAALIRL